MFTYASVARYSFIQLSELWQCGVNEIAYYNKANHRRSNPAAQPSETRPHGLTVEDLGHRRVALYCMATREQLSTIVWPEIALAINTATWGRHQAITTCSSYADDTQLYVSFMNNDAEEQLTAVARLNEKHAEI